MKKEEIETLKIKETAKMQNLLNEIDILFAKLLESLEKSSNKPDISEKIIKKAKWDYDVNRHVYLPKHFAEYVGPEMQDDYNRLADIFEEIPYGVSVKMLSYSKYNNLVDSEKKYFKGDIIITDPCYIIKDEQKPKSEPVESDYYGPIDEYDDIVEVPITELHEYLNKKDSILYEPIDNTMCKYSYKRDYAYNAYLYDKMRFDKSSEGDNERITDDWDETGCGMDVSKLGITQYISRDTIFGDWSCTVINNETQKSIGSFCADSGMVCVAEINEWKRYSPDVDKWAAEHDWCATIIKNFEGDIWFEVENTSFEEETDGQMRVVEDYTVHVVGSGTKDGAPFSFKSVIG